VIAVVFYLYIFAKGLVLHRIVTRLEVRER